MTGDEQNAFEKSIDTALGVVVGALIRAVELLAGHTDHFRGVTKKVEPCGKPYPEQDAGMPGMRCRRRKGHEPPHADCVGGDGFECVDPEHHGEPTKEPAGTFSDELVERLALVAHRAKWDGAVEFDKEPEVIRVSWKRCVRAILAELAKMPVELPSANEVCEHARASHPASTTSKDANAAMALVATRIAPILAAMEAEVERQRGVIRLQNRVLEGMVPQSQLEAERQQYETTIAQQKTRIEEQKAGCATLHTECERMEKRIAELEKQLAERDPVKAKGE
jgi:hypothetical protein